ncbi:tetratricopeptide repeat protein [Okeania sp.]|uniref:tetratricopeptide repeat protein n=1 Tax=Okeania sp. TaxID=3100323 RepID=UPI002B4AFAA8|nr:tetratricopeptide repeat protein [Okeania sp.]MEB3341851.1 tetratricopeptide repeat protein [Okeania sp.]
MENPETTALKLNQEAEFYLTQGDFDKAYATCLQALELVPDFAPVSNTIGKIMEKIDALDSAITWYNKAIEKQPNFAEFYANLGSVYVKQKLWDKGVASYQTAIKLQPNFANAYHALAEIYHQINKPELAVYSQYQAFTLKPELATDLEYLNLAKNLLKYNQKKEAIACYEKSLKLNPNLSEAHHNLGEIYSGEEKWQIAILNYQKAIELNPKFFWSHHSLGQAFAKIQQWEKAIFSYQEALQLNPQTAITCHCLGDALVKQKKLDAAINAYQRAIELQPEIWVVHHKLANLFQEKGELDAAIIAYHETIKLNPDFLWSYYSLGETFIKLQRWNEAVVAYLYAFKINQNLPSIYEKLGYVLEKQSQSNLQETINYYSEIIQNLQQQKLTPIQELSIQLERPEFYLKLGNLLEQKNLFNPATIIYNIGLQVQPNNPEINSKLAQLENQKNQLDQELADCQNTINKNPKKPIPYYQLGNTLLKFKRLNQAAETYLKAIQIKPEYPWFFFYSNLLEFLIKQRKLKQVLAFFQKVTEENPESIWCYVNLGEILTKTGNLDGAIKNYQTAAYNKTRKSHPNFVAQKWDLKNTNGPNFIIIGAQKSGTTSLENYIAQHPQVIPAIKKETHFWYRDFEKGINWYLAHFPPIPKSEKFITGEATPNYLENYQSAERIYNVFPEVKLLVILRNPVDRAFSQYNHWIRLNWDNRSFETAINSELEILRKNPEKPQGDKNYWQQPENYIGRGVYIEFIKEWLAVFPRKQILILKGEDLYEKPVKTMKKVWKFLELPEYQLPEYRKLNPGYYSPISDEMRQKLSEYFQPHNQRLEEYLGMQFDWK